MKKHNFEPELTLFKEAQEKARKADKALWKKLSPAILKAKTKRSLEKVMDALPECFTKFQIFLWMERKFGRK